MPYKFVSIEYETAEQAAAMAAKINANESGSTIQAFSNGRTLEVIPANASVADLFTLFSKVGRGIAALFQRPTATSKATANA